MFNVNKLTNFHSDTIHLDFAVPSAVPLVRIKLDSTNKILSYVYICLLPSEVSLQIKFFLKICTKTSVVKMKLIQFSIAHACLLRMF